MAKVITREWTSDGPLGKRVRHVAFGYTLTVNGTRERKFSSAWTTEGAAYEALSQRLRDIEAGRIARTEKPKRTLRQLSQEYLAYKQHEGKRTVKDDQRILEHRLLPSFGEALDVRELSSEAIARYEKERIGQVSLFTVANELGVLRHLLRKAKKWGYLDAVPDFDIPKRPEGRERYASPDEIPRLIEAAMQSPNRELAAVLVLAMNTGLRRGSLRKLRWEQIDLDRNLGLTPQITLERTKNGKPHGVPLNKDAVEALWHLQPDPAKRSGRVFHQEFDKAFKRTVEQANIVDLRFHDLRHTNASLLLNQGRSLKEVQEILGHRDFRMTLRYAHLAKSHLVSAVNAIEGLAALPKREPAADARMDNLTTIPAEGHTAAAHKRAQHAHRHEPTRISP